jgi:rare lipoprotein A
MNGTMPEQTGSMKLLGMLLAAAVLAACSGKPSQPPVDARSVISPERGNRGNPPFYEVQGKRYYVLDSSDGFRERGIASWYGRDFHGRSTSSGEVYDMNLLTAAHKTLPIPTWVEVTNLVNGRRVIVKVNDRGPFVDGRIIDLSQRAAQELGMIQAGTTRVQVRALGAPDADPALPAPVVAAAEPSRRADGGGFSLISEARAEAAGPDLRPFRPYYVQVGAFADRNNATRLAEKLKDNGFENSFVLTTGNGRDRLHRVRIGPIDSREYDRIAGDLRASGVREARLVQDN